MADVQLFPSIIPTDDSDGRDAHDQAAVAIENGECPWCEGDYENVAAHASQAHEDAWEDYKGE